jgi:dephospho-CoA kinase
VIRRAVAERFGAYTIEHDQAMRAEFGAHPGSVGRLVAAEVARTSGPVGIIEGPRTTADVEALRRELPKTKVVAIEVGDQRRHSRMLGRGRDGETTLAVLRERDRSETRLGVRAAMHTADLRVHPGDGEVAVSRSVDRLIHELALEPVTSKAGR